MARLGPFFSAIFLAAAACGISAEGSLEGTSENPEDDPLFEAAGHSGSQGGASPEQAGSEDAAAGGQPAGGAGKQGSEGGSSPDPSGEGGSQPAPFGGAAGSLPDPSGTGGSPGGMKGEPAGQEPAGTGGSEQAGGPTAPPGCPPSLNSRPVTEVAGGCYFLVEDLGGSVDGCDDYCASQGARLAWFPSLEAQNAVMNNLNAQADSYWIALRCYDGCMSDWGGPWYWFSTGQGVTYSSWGFSDSQEPNENTGCARLARNIDGSFSWYDRHCWGQFRFVCRFDP